jgi:hypothetical protein
MASSLEGEELRSYLRRIEDKKDTSATLAQLLRDLKAGKVKQEDIHAHYKAENLPRLNSMVLSFGQGNLFKAQRQNYGAWIEGIGWKDDFKLALDFRALEDLCGLGVEDVRDFIIYMVLPNGAARKNEQARMDPESHSSMWSLRCRKHSWNWTADGTR